MYLPKTYEIFLKTILKSWSIMTNWAAFAGTAGPLDNKSQDLIKLGIAIGVNSRGAVMSAVESPCFTGHR